MKSSGLNSLSEKSADVLVVRQFQWVHHQYARPVNNSTLLVLSWRTWLDQVISLQLTSLAPFLCDSPAEGIPNERNTGSHWKHRQKPTFTGQCGVSSAAIFTGICWDLRPTLGFPGARSNCPETPDQNIINHSETSPSTSQEQSSEQWPKDASCDPQHNRILQAQLWHHAYILYILITCPAVKLLVLNVLQSWKTNHHQKPVSPKKERDQWWYPASRKIRSDYGFWACPQDRAAEGLLETVAS